ncbi:endolytic transglycosylase MltG [Patescibacteria group bacterium]|nr:endolytic transglycosylase MltG [Patescibacteria group bacterium]
MLRERLLSRRFLVGAAATIAVVGIASRFLYDLAPVAAVAAAQPTVFEVKKGEGFRTVVDGLASAGIVRSSFATATFAVITGRAFDMQPGLYHLDPSMSTWQVLNVITSRAASQVVVTIPEGANLYQIDAILASALVIRRGDLVNFHDDGNLEGKLFPDTYQFFTDSNVKDVVQKFLDDFNAKAAPLLAADPKNAADDLVVASLVAKEVPGPSDQEIVAGIIWKRLRAGMLLDIDATICYIKFMESPTSTANCDGLNKLDYKVNSPYNTYLHQGLPPGPIGNPGITAINAAISPQSSPYYYYLSDPATGKTIFAKTLDEQNRNRVKYLQSN